jgi:hypothetical protein
LELIRELLESDIRSVVYELPRIPVPRTSVNSPLEGCGVSTRALRCVFLVARGRRFARRQPVGALVATLVEFLAPPRLTHSPPRRVGRPEVPPFSSRGVMQADVTELGRPGRDKPQLVVLGGSVSLVSTGFKWWEIFTVGSVSFVSRVFRRFAFCGRPERSSALPLAQSSSGIMFTFFFFKAI